MIDHKATLPIVSRGSTIFVGKYLFMNLYSFVLAEQPVWYYTHLRTRNNSSKKNLLSFYRALKYIFDFF